MAEEIKQIVDLTYEGTDLFLDSCIVSREYASWYIKNVRDKRTFLHLDDKLLGEVAESVRYISQIFIDKRVEIYCPPKVACEIHQFNRILRAKFKEMDEWVNLNPHSRNTLHRRKDSFWQIMENYKLLQRLVEFNKFYPNTSDYELFEKLENEIIRIGIDSGAKKKTKIYLDSPESHGAKGSSSEKEDLRTDEQIIASAVYNSIIFKKPGNVVTSDGDLGRLITATVNEFSARQDSKDSYKHLRKFPVKVYYTLENSKVKLIADSTNGASPNL